MSDALTLMGDITRAETDVAISTAKAFPRSVARFRQDAMTMATIDAEVAASCFYRLSRGGKTIEGPSVRLAEIVASAWGNLKFGARIVSEDDRYVVAQGVAHDLEKNVQNTVEVRRRITNKDGMKYSDDMIAVTCNAACSIALRNAIFKTIPFTYAKTIFEQAKKTAIGDVKTVGLRRQQMVEAFGKMGVTLEMVLTLVGKVSIEDVGLGEIETLVGVFTAIKEGDTTIEEQFPDSEEEALSPEEAALRKDSKKKRAALNKALFPCQTREAHALALKAFYSESKASPTAMTYTREGETYLSLSDEHLGRITSREKALPGLIGNAATKEAFHKLLDEISLHAALDTADNQEIIANAGRGLGIEEYFAEEVKVSEATAKPYA